MLAMVANAPTDATSPLLPSVTVFPDYREQLHDHLTRVPSSDGIKCMSYLMNVLDEPTQAQLAVVYGTPLLELQALSVMRGPYYEQDNVRFWQILMVSVNAAVDCHTAVTAHAATRNGRAA